MIFIFGETAKLYLTKYIDKFSIAFVVLSILGFLAVRFFIKRMAVKE
jgi:hypothetical protein